MEYKIGDKVRLNNDPNYDTWSGVVAIIIGINHGRKGQYWLQRINDAERGNIGSHGFTKVSREIKVFDDE